MKNFKKLLVLGVFVFTIMATSLTAFAASQYNTPAEAAAGLTGRTVDGVVQERFDSKKTYAAIANDAGKLEEFKAEILEIRKENLEKQVSEGKITAEAADRILERINENQLYCDGSGDGGRMGPSLGAKFGSKGEGLGKGGELRGNGLGRGHVNGNSLNKGIGNTKGSGGLRLQDGSCYAR